MLDQFPNIVLDDELDRAAKCLAHPSAGALS